MQFTFLLINFLLFEAIFAEEDVSLERDQLRVTIECDGVSKWFNPYGDLIVASKKYKIEGNNLTIGRIGEMDVGKYYCLVGPTNHSLNLLSPPYIVKLEKSVNVVEGEEVEVVCKVWGSEKPIVKWNRVMDDGSVQFISGNKTLSILSTTIQDYGNYRCEANNSQGSTNQTTKIRVKDKLAPLWPFIGIVLEVLVLVIIIIIYERRKRNKDPEESIKDATKVEATRDPNVRNRK